MLSLEPALVRVPIFDTPDGREFWTTPDMDYPLYSSEQAARTFFGRSGQWLRQQGYFGKLQIDGQPIELRRNSRGWFLWSLHDIERAAHGLTQNGYMQVEHLQRVLSVVKLVAENHKYLPQSELVTVVTPRSDDPDRKARMAIQVLAVVSDDLDGSPGAKTRHFSVESVRYRIDLTDEHWEQFLAAVAPYTTTAQPDKRRRAPSEDEMAERASIREWARKNEFEVGARGRIPVNVIEAYNQAHQSNGKHAIV